MGSQQQGLASGAKLGRYEVVKLLGKGGMGEVYLTKDQSLGREVALKVLPEEFAHDAERLGRFEREAKAVAALNHPNILSIYDFGKEGDTAYTVTELLEGETLRERLSSGPLPARKSVEYAAQIAKGLAAAHDKGIVHRDLKPENLFVTKDGHVKILDFGLAGLAPLPDSNDTKSPTITRHTEPGTLMGTLGYMSPEQARGKAADPRSDLFSLGAVLYEMVSGQRAFQGESQADVLSAILREDPPELNVSGKPAPAALDHVVRVCLEKRPEDRFSSAHDLALALEGLAGTEAAPSAAKRRGGKRLGLAIGVPALILAFVLIAYFQERQDREKPSVHPIRSIAVLPLANLSGDPNQEYFADGMTDALITDLYKISGFEKVISRTSVMQYKGAKKPLPQIGHELGVEALLEGSVQRAGDRVRITVQLIDAKNDKHLWAESYDREMRDVLNLQSEIALAVAKQVQIALTPAETTRVGKKRMVDPETYDAYLRAATLLYGGRDEASKRDAMAQLERLTEKDPGFAPAWASLGDAYQWLADLGLDRPSDRYAESRTAIEKALELDPDLAIGHALNGCYKFRAEWDWEGADREFRRAMELDRNNVVVLRYYTSYLSSMKRFDEAVELGKRYVALDPFMPYNRLGLMDAYFYSGRYEESMAQAWAALSRSPDGLYELSELCTCQFFLGQRQEALATLEREEKAFAEAGEPFYFLPWLGGDYARLGQRQKAVSIVKRLEATDPDRAEISFALAYVNAWLGDNDGAMRWLEHGYARKETYLAFLYRETFPEKFREDPRFKAFLCKMKFPGACEGKP